METDCIFCAIGERSAAAEVVEADIHTIAFLDINPATRGHTLVVPRVHARNLYDIEEEDLMRAVVMAQALAVRMQESLGADGVNLINSCGAAAWQTVPHFHLHVIPRYDGDPLKLPWIPTPADPNDLTVTADLLR